MPVLERRVEVLFDPEVYERVEQLAAREGRSVGSVIRNAVDARLKEQDEARLAAIESIRRRAALDDGPAMTLEEWQSIKNDTLTVMGGDLP
jgi:hypothetical protein